MEIKVAMATVNNPQERSLNGLKGAAASQLRGVKLSGSAARRGAARQAPPSPMHIQESTATACPWGPPPPCPPTGDGRRRGPLTCQFSYKLYTPKFNSLLMAPWHFIWGFYAKK